MKPALLITLLMSLGAMSSVSAAWLRLPPSTEAIVNHANKNVLGTTVVSSEGMSNAANLVSGDASLAATLAVGKNELVISFPEQHMIDAASFLNDRGVGKMVIAASSDSKEWISLAQVVFEESDRYVPVKFAGAQAKYVRLTFEVSKASDVRSLHIGGNETLKDYKAFEIPEGTKKAVEVDAAALARSSKPIYVFPTPVNAGDSDGSREKFRFPRTAERYRTIVYDLGAVRTIKKFSAAYSRIPTRVEVFTFEQLPEKQDWRGKMTLDPSIFDTTKPAATGEDARGDGNIRVAPEQPVSAQYVALRFEPNYHKRGVAGLNPEWEAMGFAALVPFGGLLREFGVFEAGMGEHIQAQQGQDDNVLVQLNFRGRVISVPAYLVNQYLAAGATLVNPPAASNQSALGQGEVFEIYDVDTGAGVQRILISNSAIAKVQAANPGMTAEAAVSSILTAAGFTGTTTAQGTTTQGGTTPMDAADTALASANAGLNALGLSAYRGSGGSGGSGGGGGLTPEEIAALTAGTGTGTTSPPINTSASSPPIIITTPPASTVVPPTTP